MNDKQKQVYKKTIETNGRYCMHEGKVNYSCYDCPMYHICKKGNKDYRIDTDNLKLQKAKESVK